MSVTSYRDMFQMVLQSRDNLLIAWVGRIIVFLNLFNELLAIHFLTQYQKGESMNTIRYGIFPSE